MEKEEKIHAELTAEQVARLKLKIERAEKPSWFSRDAVSWEENGESYRMEIPNGLDEAGALQCVRIRELGREEGADYGREELRGQLRELLGAEKED